MATQARRIAPAAGIATSLALLLMTKVKIETGCYTSAHNNWDTIKHARDH